VVNAPHCLVPRLGGERLAAAKKKLAAADCRLGKVRGRRTRSALVVHQAPGAGERLAAGAKVGVVLRGHSHPTHKAAARAAKLEERPDK
jgi:beta-lactam-binding protein with PASTA domain